MMGSPLTDQSASAMRAPAIPWFGAAVGSDKVHIVVPMFVPGHR
jgi:hypothetical protein